MTLGDDFFDRGQDWLHAQTFKSVKKTEVNSGVRASLAPEVAEKLRGAGESGMSSQVRSSTTGLNRRTFS